MDVPPGYYTHSPVTGQRVAQYEPEQPSIVPVDPTYQESGYRHQLIQLGTDNLNLVQTWGEGTAIRPYGEWQYPFRAGATPFGPWGNPQGPWTLPFDSWRNPYGLNRPSYGYGATPYGCWTGKRRGLAGGAAAAGHSRALFQRCTFPARRRAGRAARAGTVDCSATGQLPVSPEE